MKIFSWNVNGLRAVLNKGALQKLIKEQKPDILCLQEIKAKKEQVLIDLPEYEEIWNPAERPGYSGTAIFSKIKPLNTFTKNSLNEGRVLVAEFKDFYLIDVYTPNSKPDLSRLGLREKEWDPNFREFLKSLEEKKPVITCGDFNAAHEEIDIARPKTNHHSAGFTDEERRGITNLIADGFIDTFRTLHPNSIRYTWWSHWGKARENNVGWRIDYFFISKSLLPRLKQAEIFENHLGSDHCPIMIEVE